jgi:hypothetical protein
MRDAHPRCDSSDPTGIGAQGAIQTERANDRCSQEGGAAAADAGPGKIRFRAHDELSNLEVSAALDTAENAAAVERLHGNIKRASKAEADDTAKNPKYFGTVGEFVRLPPSAKVSTEVKATPIIRRRWQRALGRRGRSRHVGGVNCRNEAGHDNGGQQYTLKSTHVQSPDLDGDSLLSYSTNKFGDGTTSVILQIIIGRDICATVTNLAAKASVIRMLRRRPVHDPPPPEPDDLAITRCTGWKHQLSHAWRANRFLTRTGLPRLMGKSRSRCC